MENEIVKVFKSKDFGKIRTAIVNNEPWFVGKDVASCLAYKDTSDALKKHVDAEDKGVYLIDTLGGKQNVIIINESGLYHLLMRSEKMSASKKQAFITSLQKEGYL